MTRPKNITDMQAFDIATSYLESATGIVMTRLQQSGATERSRRNAERVIRCIDFIEERERSKEERHGYET